ncbi:LOW QUALITY PROTEIN: NADH-ubiquinone oxidoreductase chain 5-like [Lycium barbarum]|uniref:LOW QUALITY PROTEIN: NADH-ubiquinone oxidoreductase chain 5-like n=1 Tax=Lycium barbarum TaxID=112863 RepID=UPI00293E2B06|nr:LOW QUALITY PROTEIN: NADH-ubiquinone oxidoreductase chain 5-like [Lycium barbarum]
MIYKPSLTSAICASAPRNSWISCNMRLNAITLICILLFIGDVGKSAQIGSHTWSPDAMEGPTPVSALIHAATMVTAGVFMIARCSPLFEYPPTALIVITFTGAMTSFLAATTGILQNDLKRVIAYSTCSQLGYMIFACGISNYSVSVFHLMNHAFFKALLFLSAGSVIHAMSDEQDMRKMGGGGLASSFPFTYAMMLMGSLSLIGFPFLTGFYSKDVILELAYTKYTISGNFAFWLGSVSVLFTSYYSFRSLFLTFLVPTNSFGRDILRCHDAPIPMAIPLILLALGSPFLFLNPSPYFSSSRMLNTQGYKRKGEILALMGPSGSGKTTLLKILGGRLQENVRGTVTYNDIPYNTAINRRLPSKMSRRQNYERAEVIIKELGLERCRHTRIGGGLIKGISGGERKRTSIGYEILVDPSLLLLDEPTSGLDSSSARKERVGSPFRLSVARIGRRGSMKAAVEVFIHLARKGLVLELETKSRLKTFSKTTLSAWEG